MTVDATATAAEREVLHACFEAARAHPFYRARYRDCRGIDDAPAIDKRDLLPALQAFSLRDEPRGVYLVRSGRMCVAGLNVRNVGVTAEAIAAVLV